MQAEAGIHKHQRERENKEASGNENRNREEGRRDEKRQPPSKKWRAIPRMPTLPSSPQASLLTPLGPVAIFFATKVE